MYNPFGRRNDGAPVLEKVCTDASLTDELKSLDAHGRLLDDLSLIVPLTDEARMSLDTGFGEDSALLVTVGRILSESIKGPELLVS